MPRCHAGTLQLGFWALLQSCQNSDGPWIVLPKVPLVLRFIYCSFLILVSGIDVRGEGKGNPEQCGRITGCAMRYSGLGDNRQLRQNLFRKVCQKCIEEAQKSRYPALHIQSEISKCSSPLRHDSTYLAPSSSWCTCQVQADVRLESFSLSSFSFLIRRRVAFLRC